MLKRPRVVLASAFFLLTTTWVCAQNVEITTEVDTHQVPVGGQVTMQISVRGEASDSDEPRFPMLPDFSIQQAGVSRQLSMINGQTSGASIYTYVLTPHKEGHYRIPPVTVEINGKSWHTDPIVIDVGPSTGHPHGADPSFSPPGTHRPSNPAMPGIPGGLPGLPGAGDPWRPGSTAPQPDFESIPAPQPKGPLVFVEAEANPKTPYVNQPVVYTFRFLHRINIEGNPNFEPPANTGFLKEDLSQKTSQTERNGTIYSQSEAKMLFFPTAAGQFSIGPTRLTARLSLEELAALDNMASIVDTVRELVAEAVPIYVRNLPSKGRPSDFSGAVGNSFSIKASVDKTRLEQGQALNLKLEVDGDGHPDFISQPTLPVNDDFQFYSAKSSSQISRSPEFRGTKIFEIPVVAVRAGDLKIPSIALSYFSPKSNRYETASTEALTIHVTPSKTAPAPVSSSTPGSAESPAVRDENALRGPKTVDKLKSPLGDPPAWVWGLHLLPWLGLGLWYLARISRSWWTARSLAQSSSSLGRRTCAHLRKLPDDQVDQASSLLYVYLEARLAEKLAGVPLHELARILLLRGVPADSCRELSRLMADLEAYRYAPRTSAESTLAAELRERSAVLLTELEKTLR